MYIYVTFLDVSTLTQSLHQMPTKTNLQKMIHLILKKYIPYHPFFLILLPQKLGVSRPKETKKPTNNQRT